MAHLAGLLKGIGVQRVDVADTIGVGTPRKVQRAIDAALQHYGHRLCFGTLPRHLWSGAVQHPGGDGTVGVELPVLRGWPGGCPYAKGATGNVATEMWSTC